MNKEILYEALFSPSRVGEVPREELERVAREYPYFNSAQVLLARSYRQTGDHRFSDQLQVASQTSGDRLSLYHLLKENPPIPMEVKKVDQTEKEFVETIEVPTADETTIDVTSEKSETVFVAPVVLRPLVAPDVPSGQTGHSERAEKIVAAVEIIEPIAKSVPPSIETTAPEVEEVEKPVRDALEEAILARAVSSSIEIEVGEQTPEGEIEAESVEAGEIISEFKSEPEPQIEENEDSFASWIAKRAKDIGYQEDKPKSSRLPTYNEDGQLRIQPSENKKKTQQDLIDRFIQTNPRIQPGKSDEYDLENIAKTSITEDLSVVSETMAVLLASQGKKEKARRVYRKLMELHPEKSVYFAAQLKILDKLK
jgi:hypothetical protein